MNIFYLDHDPAMAARYHNSKHVVKMITETCQLLSTCKRFFGCTDGRLYESTHINHPSNVWLREGVDNYLWTLGLLKELIKEYDYRYTSGKHQRARSLVDVFADVPAIPAGSTPIKLAMPDEFRHSDPVVEVSMMDVEIRTKASRGKSISVGRFEIVDGTLWFYGREAYFFGPVCICHKGYYYVDNQGQSNLGGEVSFYLRKSLESKDQRILSHFLFAEDQEWDIGVFYEPRRDNYSTGVVDNPEMVSMIQTYVR